MTESHDLAQLALSLADGGFDDRVARLIEAAGRDPQALSAAVGVLIRRYPNTDAREHVAFSYLTTAFRECVSDGDLREQPATTV